MGIKRAIIVAAVAGLAVGPALAGAPKGWKTYTDPKNGWSISYPANFTVDTKYQSIEMDPPVGGTAFNLPASWGKGTNLDDALVSVEVLPGKNCKPSQFLSDPEEIKTVKADGRTYVSAFMPDSAMMQKHYTSLFLVSGTCTAIAYFVHSTEREVMDPMPKEYDDAKLTKLFDSIRATLKLKGEH